MAVSEILTASSSLIESLYAKDQYKLSAPQVNCGA